MWMEVARGGARLASLAAALMLVLAASARAADLYGYGYSPYPPVAPGAIVDLGDRFKLIEVYQPERNLDRSSRRLNLLFDTETGRSWVLRHAPPPGSNAPAYVWVEVPMAAPR
jgi:hypothetical protein